MVYSWHCQTFMKQRQVSTSLITALKTSDTNATAALPLSDRGRRRDLSRRAQQMRCRSYVGAQRRINSWFKVPVDFLVRWLTWRLQGWQNVLRDAAMAGESFGTDAAETSGAETAVIAHCVGTACRRIKSWFTLHVALLLWLTMAT